MIDRINTERAEHNIPHAVSCRALEVSESWFYKYRNAPPPPTRQRRDRLDAAILEAFEANNGEYGSPRIHEELVELAEWQQLSVNTVAERMAALCLRGRKKRRRRCLTRADKNAPKFENLLKRQFNPPAPHVAWVGDITEIKTWEGKLYLATVIDLYSRRLIGFAIAEHYKATLVCDALRMAIAVRGAQVEGVIMHTDRGSQYTARSFRKLCKKWKITQSMSRAGSCLDNAVAESFFSTFKNEVVYRMTLPTKADARHEFIAWFDRYNRTRRHSYCKMQSPLNYEKMTTPAALAA